MTAVALFVLFSVTGSLTGCRGDRWSDWLLAFAFAVFVYFVADVLYPEQSFCNILCVVKVNTEELLKSSY